MHILNLLPVDATVVTSTGARHRARFDVLIGETLIRHCVLAEYANGKNAVWGPQGGSVVFGPNDRRVMLSQALTLLAAATSDHAVRDAA